MLPKLDAATGNLPIGRFPATLENIKGQFVDAESFLHSDTRSAIWNEFEYALSGLQQALPVAWIWIGGSFISKKLNPDDIDVVIWAKDEDIHAVSDPKDIEIVELFAFNKVREITGLRVDSRICGWHVIPQAGIQNTPQHHQYLSLRGFWDDFWMRKRSGSKTDPLKYEDAFPKRGYFEVFMGGAS